MVHMHGNQTHKWSKDFWRNIKNHMVSFMIMNSNTVMSGDETYSFQIIGHIRGTLVLILRQSNLHWSKNIFSC